ncbi:MAG: hypothetical protein ACYSU7_12515 [Planctomycetota bacterium]|jgi:hypothetical protein
MKTSRSTAERIRPILQAMERSIESARRRRLHESESPPQPRPVPVDPRDNGGDALPRRKARPKRSSPEPRQFGGSEYRAEAV